MKCYVVIAYRYGWSNAEWYIVHVGTDEITARAFAQSECYERGGKYGIEIQDEAQSRIAYYPSAWGEKRPRFNKRIALGNAIGARVLGELDKAGGLYVHEWIREEFKKQKDILDALHPEETPE